MTRKPKQDEEGNRWLCLSGQEPPPIFKTRRKQILYLYDNGNKREKELLQPDIDWMNRGKIHARKMWIAQESREIEKEISKMDRLNYTDKNTQTKDDNMLLDLRIYALEQTKAQLEYWESIYEIKHPLR